MKAERAWCYDDHGQHFVYVSVEEAEKLEAEIERLQEELRAWVPMPKSLSGWGEPDADELAIETIREACKVHGVDFGQHERRVAEAGGK